MGIIETRKQQRFFTITRIIKAISMARAKGIKLQMCYLIPETQKAYNISNRTAKEYITQALYELELDKDFNKISVQEKLL